MLGVGLVALASCEGEPGFRKRWESLERAGRDPEHAQQTVHDLLRMIEDPRVEWRSAGQRGLNLLAPHHARMLVTTYAETEYASPDYRNGIRLALSQAGAAAVEAVHQQIYTPGTWRIRDLGAILAQIGPASLPVLERDLENPEPKYRGYALWALGEMGESALPLMDAILRQEESDVPGVIRVLPRALIAIAPTDPRVGPCLDRLQRRGDPSLTHVVRECRARLEFVLLQASPEALLREYEGDIVAIAIENCSKSKPGALELATGVLQVVADRIAAGQPPEGMISAAELADPISIVRELESVDPSSRGSACLKLACLGEQGRRLCGSLDSARQDSD